jgi:orotidine-5'-phosphate decarboxylase
MDLSQDFDRRLILALDEPCVDAARRLADRVKDKIACYKVGLTLLAQGGLELAQDLAHEGKLIFQDWKLHDIGAQVEGATKAISMGACDFLTVHAEPQVMREAVQGRVGDRIKILGVTVLTSLNDDDLVALGYGQKARDLVMRRVEQALDCAIDGVVASPLEAAMIRAQVPPEFLIITPGVRPEGAALDDQQRVATPQSALINGASHVVIGRPISRAPNPLAAATAILQALHKV